MHQPVGEIGGFAGRAEKTRAQRARAEFFRSLADGFHRKRAAVAAHFARRAGLLLGGDARQDEAGEAALLVAPLRLQRGHKIGLRAQDNAVIDDFQRIGAQSRAARRDIDDDLGLPRRRRALCRAQTLDDAVVSDAVGAEKLSGEIYIFRRHPHPLAAPGAEGGGDIFDIRHAAHVDPGLRHGDDDIGIAEAQRREQLHARVRVSQGLAQKVLAGDAHVDAARAELADDFGGREKGDLDAGHAGELAAVVARAARLRDGEAGAREKCGGVFLQAALGRDGENERGGHEVLSRAGRRSIQTAAPTAGMSEAAPSFFIRPS